MIAAIVAVDNDWGIGFNGELLEHIPDDLKNFKKLTTGNFVVMGRKTWDSLPKKPLPDRLNLVITRQERNFESLTAFIHLDEVIARMKATSEVIDWFVIGGGMIYKELLPLCDTIYVTKIYKSHNNIDTYFPNLDEMENWEGKPISDIMDYKDLKYQFWQYNYSN